MSTTADEVWQLLRELVQSQQENALQFQETNRQFQENALQFKETDRRLKETNRQVKELGKQIGGLGKKFGSFTEGLALPSMETLLREKFSMEIISPSVRASKNGQHLEIDVLAYANGEINSAYVVEVKSHVREEAIEQLRTILERFRYFFPEHQNKTLYGILAGVDLSAALRDKILAAGFYVARIHDLVFELDTPIAFQPQGF
ncbi:DUF3782 domain-containing protein [Synechocystis salina LEGE 06155]|nr:DUF3782 domain-containing protein [Synechocystis salina LEGE 06155]